MNLIRRVVDTCLLDIEGRTMVARARTKKRLQDAEIKLFIAQVKESETCLKAWGEDAIRAKGFDVEKIKATIEKTRKFCEQHNYTY